MNSNHGWITSEILNCIKIEIDELDAIYEKAGEGYENEPDIQEILENGYSFYCHNIEKKWVPRLEDYDPVSVEQELKAFCEKTRETGKLYTLYSSRDMQYAKGTICVLEGCDDCDCECDGDEFLPVWTCAEHAKMWLDTYPSYVVKSISLKEYNENLLEGLNDESEQLGIGSQSEYLMMVHPDSINLDW